MAKINRDYVLKTFLDKVKEAKRQGMKEIKIPIAFLDDMAYIIYQLMSEEISKAFEMLEVKPKEEKKPSLPISRKVLREINPIKLTKEEKPAIIEPVKEEIKEEKDVKEEPILPKVEPVKEEIKEEIVEEDNEEDNDNIMYGGTW